MNAQVWENAIELNAVWKLFFEHVITLTTEGIQTNESKND